MVTLCLECMSPTEIHTWEETNMEPYGERYVPRVERYAESECCKGEYMELTNYQLADEISNIVPETYRFFSNDESLDALYIGKITDLEQALLIEYFEENMDRKTISDKYHVKALKVSDEPTEEQKNNWIVYCWLEDLLCQHCNYSTENYTEYRVEVYGNEIFVRWRL